jgi:hypothetical protein
MDAAVIYKWDATVPGREAAGMQLMQDTNDFCDKAIADGKITSYEWFLSAGLGWNLLVVRGAMESLQALMATPQLQMLSMRSGLINEGLQFGYFACGDSIEPAMGAFGAAVEQLT